MSLEEALEDQDVRWWWVSATWATCGVAVKADIIVWTPAIWKKFKGQPFSNLKRWLRKNGSPLRVVSLEQRTKDD